MLFQFFFHFTFRLNVCSSFLLGFIKTCSSIFLFIQFLHESTQFIWSMIWWFFYHISFEMGNEIFSRMIKEAKVAKFIMFKCLRFMHRFAGFVERVFNCISCQTQNCVCQRWEAEHKTHCFFAFDDVDGFVFFFWISKWFVSTPTEKANQVSLAFLYAANLVLNRWCLMWII